MKRVTITIQPDLHLKAASRIKELNPIVADFSDYVRRLIVTDLANDTLNTIPTFRSSDRSKRNNFLKVALAGFIPAGQAVPAEQLNEEFIDCPSSLFHGRSPEHFFALKVSGDSMINADIKDKDIILLEKRPAVSGDIVAALVDGENTLKRYLFKNNQHVLHAENPNFNDIHPINDLVCQGVFVGVIN